MRSKSLLLLHGLEINKGVSFHPIVLPTEVCGPGLFGVVHVDNLNIQFPMSYTIFVSLSFLFPKAEVTQRFNNAREAANRPVHSHGDVAKKTLGLFVSSSVFFFSLVVLYSSPEPIELSSSLSRDITLLWL
jgi:hypothetical protein